MQANLLAKKISNLKKAEEARSLNDFLSKIDINKPILVESSSEIRTKSFIDFLANSAITDYSRDSVSFFHASRITNKQHTQLFLSELYNQDLFNSDKIIVLQAAESANKTQLTELFKHINNSTPPNLLIISFKKLEKSSILFKNKDSFFNIIIEELKGDQLPKWITNEFAKETNSKAKISLEACKSLLQYFNNDLDKIKSQLSLIALGADDGEEISSKNIESICSPEISADTFELVSAILQNNLRLSKDKVSTLLQNGQAPLQIVFFISKVIRTLIYSNGMKSKQLESKALKNSWFIKSAKNIPTSEKQLKAIIKLLFELDKKLKSSGIEDSLVLENYILKMASIKK